MEIYLVGGAVRDGLLGLSVKDRDWVVVGGDDEQLRARGLQPADRAFSVYRDPASGDEYALARRETKRGAGYRGFDIDDGPDVTLEEDLSRRDLTVNAMAQAADGALIDPFGGREDLDLGRLRHVSPAFVEDPVRVLRIARFAAYLGRHGFRVAHGTHRLLCEMVEQGEIAHLNEERIGRETMRAMATEQPWRYFEVLHRCGALAVLVPGLASAMGEPDGHTDRDDSAPVSALKRITSVSNDPQLRLAVVLLSATGVTADAELMARTLRVDRRGTRLLRRLTAAIPLLEPLGSGDPQAMYQVLTSWRAFSEPEEAGTLALALEAVGAQPGLADRLQRGLTAALAADLPDVDAVTGQEHSARELVATARQQAIARVLA